MQKAIASGVFPPPTPPAGTAAAGRLKRSTAPPPHSSERRGGRVGVGGSRGGGAEGSLLPHPSRGCGVFLPSTAKWVIRSCKFTAAMKFHV